MKLVDLNAQWHRMNKMINVQLIDAIENEIVL
jgi:hypothetical protein